uniref:Uncharacterized protein n=1 Tax=Romanomermis culicivorax TaxID=13658 RepID=A0A915KA43_ROMCU
MLCCIVLYCFIFVFVYYLFKYFVLEKFFYLKNIEKRHVFITGCDTGFGRKLALKLADNGAPVFAGCFSQQGGRSLADEAKKFSGKLTIIDLDVRKNGSLEEAKKIVEKELNGRELWAIVCNAGISHVTGADDFLTVEDYASTLEVNTFGVIRTCHVFKPLIKKSRGRIVIMCSMLCRLALPHLGPYVVSKFATAAYADILRMETKPFGVTVHTMEPGFYKTGITNCETVVENYAKLWSKVPQEVKDEYGETFYNQMVESVKNNLTAWSSDNLDEVIDAYYHALMARFPRDRYVLGSDAKYIFRLISLLPTWAQDFLICLLAKKDNVPLPAACCKYSKLD